MERHYENKWMVSLKDETEELGNQERKPLDAISNHIATVKVFSAKNSADLIFMDT